ncbi:MAG: hypothetical protein LBU16_03030 [Treponema sp.]|jgi:hypothetical protein|nr:hypothetical protein [Treponema sp.]
MAANRDWLPKSRTEHLTIADEWISVCAAQKTAWSIPDAALTELTARRDGAAAALETAKNETTRTSVATARCRETFDALIAYMRDFKRRYFLSPPLTDADYVSLGLKPHDSIPTPSGPFAAQAMVETYLVGRHELGIKLIYVTGNPSDPANKGYRVWYSVVAPGQTPPADPEDLRHSFFTKRKKDVIEFEFGDSGKTACFAVQIENDKMKGQWGPMVKALIP